MTPSRNGTKAALTLGYLCLTFAFVRAHNTPMRGYEASIYTATPLGFWVGVTVACIVAAAALLYVRERVLFGAATGLLIATTMAVVTLPLSRGYFSYGQGDALTHLGWIREVLTQDMSAFELVYPGTHVTTMLIRMVTGMAETQAMMVVIALFVLVYLVFVPLVIRMLVGDRSAVAISVVAASFLLPVTNISTFLDYHPFTLAAFAFPVVLYFLFRHLGAPTAGSALTDARSRSGKMLVFVFFSLVLLHPQVALDALILSGTIAVVQQFAGRLPSSETIRNGRRLSVPTAIATGLFAAWALRYEVVTRMVGYVWQAVGEFWGTGGGNAGETVAQNGGSLSDIGVSIVEVFGKLFFVHLVFSILSGAIVLALLAGQLDRKRAQRNDVVMYFTYGGITLTPFFLLHFLGDVSTYFFRHVGFAMVIVTILGVLALHSARRWLPKTGTGALARPFVLLLTVCLVAFAMFTLFPSPFIYQSTPGVPAAEMNGYQTTFEYTEPGVEYSGLRQGPSRYEDALNTNVPTTEHITAENITANRLSEQTNEPYYLVVSDYDRKVETAGFRGVDYNQTAFDRLDENPGVSRILTNDGLVVYYVTPSAAVDEAAEVSANETASTGAQNASDDASATNESEDASDDASNGDESTDQRDATRTDSTATDDTAGTATDGTDSEPSGNNTDAADGPSENGTDTANGESGESGENGVNTDDGQNGTDTSDDESGENTTNTNDGQGGDTDDTDDTADSVDGLPRVSGRTVTDDVSWQMRAATA